MAEGISGGGFKFNEGLFQMQRIDSLQASINECKINPLRPFNDTGNVAYEVWFNCLKALFSEISSKLKDEEIKECDELCLEIKKIIYNYQLYKIQYNSSGRAIGKELNYAVWERLENLFDKYERKIRKLMAVHKISSIESYDPSKAVIT